MSYDNAISKRAQMNIDYQKMLDLETDPIRQAAIKKQIALNDDEILQLRQGKPLFGNPIPLKQETKIIETDPETKEQKVTILGETNKETENTEPETQPEEKVVSTELITPKKKPVSNKLRDVLQAKKALSVEESLKAKVLAAKANKTV